MTITTGANEGMLCAFMAFIEDGDEVIVFEPYFDQYGVALSLWNSVDLPQSIDIFPILKCLVALFDTYPYSPRGVAHQRGRQPRTGLSI